MPDPQPGSSPGEQSVAEAERRRSSRAVANGVSIILVTGFLAVTQIGLHFHGTLGLVLLMLMIATTLTGAWLLHRFILRHGSEIGEARFDTRNERDVGDGDQP